MWVESLRDIIPQRYFGALTKEKAFEMSMTDKDTQLTFVDEFVPKEYVSNDTANLSFKVDFLDKSLAPTNSAYYLCCQDELFFGKDERDKKRLAIFKTKALQTAQNGADLNLKKNAI